MSSGKTTWPKPITPNIPSPPIYPENNTPPKQRGGYQKSDRRVHLNGGSRANIVYHKGGSKEAYVKVGGGFKSLDKNYAPIN